jgi:hypothetical protein
VGYELGGIYFDAFEVYGGGSGAGGAGEVFGGGIESGFY